MQTDFFRTEERAPHMDRARAIRQAHPEVADLAGHNPWTAVITFGIVAGQTAIAALLGTFGLSYWWLALIAALFVGAFANHALYVVIHDATHNLIFRNRWLNRAMLVVADLPNVIPGAMGFRINHLHHHSGLSGYDTDTDVPSHWEARLVGDRWYAKALWLFLFPVVQLTRLARTGSPPALERWYVANFLASPLYGLAVFYFFGGNALLYLLWSFWFSISLHPVGARWIQEHFSLDPSQTTHSYYGKLNLIALNIGYHNEHHDFPNIPWNRLPRLRAIAPEFYEHLGSHRSWTRLLLSFIFDKRYTLYSRLLHEPPKARPAAQSAAGEGARRPAEATPL